jgi:hypothetical protein
MKILRNTFTIVSLLIIILLGVNDSSAQDNNAKTSLQNQSSFRVYFQTVLGSDQVNTKKTPTNLTQVINQIKTDYPYSNYQLISTSYHQISDQGQIQSATILKSIGDFGIESSPIFVEWTLGPIDKREESLNTIKFIRFNFNAEFPVKINDILSYRKIKYNLSRIRVNENVPTVFGSLSVPQSDETIFFVLTVKEIKP